MSNFGDEEYDEELRRQASEESVEEPLEDVEPDPDSFWNRKAVRIPMRIGLGLFIIGTAIALYWARIPPVFEVEEAAREMAIEKEHRLPDQPLPVGYRTVSTMVTLANQLFTKPGGYQSNGISPMTRIPDNMRNWEYGYVIQLRVLVQGLRFDLGRAGVNAVDHKELREAEGRFNFKHDNIVLPSTDRQYKQGRDLLADYLDKLNSAASPGQFFAPRNDQLINWLEKQKNMLGSYTTMLQDNIGTMTLDTGVLTSAPIPTDEVVAGNATEGVVANKDGDDNLNSFLERDDTFYQVRGGVYALYHTMQAVRTDCKDVINASNAMGIMNRVLNELEQANNPMKSPMVLNGSEYGIIQNHSLVLAAHLAKAHLAIQELQRQLAGGGR
jgi:hypothetical protein